MLVRYGRLDGLKRRSVRKRVARLLADRGRLADEEVDAVTEIASPAEGKHRRAGHNVIRFASPDERYTVLAGVLEVLSRERPVVLVADDVHYGADALGFCLHLQRAVGRELPILVVMTARDDLLVERVAERELVDALLDGGARVATLAAPMLRDADPGDPNVVKVVASAAGHALYFSRRAIPYEGPWLRHLGIYGFTPDALRWCTTAAEGHLAASEDLEQLRWLEAGARIHLGVVDEAAASVDTEEQLTILRRRLASGEISSPPQPT